MNCSIVVLLFRTYPHVFEINDNLNQVELIFLLTHMLFLGNCEIMPTKRRYDLTLVDISEARISDDGKKTGSVLEHFFLYPMFKTYGLYLS